MCLCGMVLAAAEMTAYGTDSIVYSLSLQTAVHSVKLPLFEFGLILTILLG